MALMAHCTVHGPGSSGYDRMASYQRLVERLRSFLSWTVQRWKLALVLIVLLGLVAEGPPPASLDTRVNRILAGERFDFAGWEIKALMGKLAHSLIAPQRYMDEVARHDFFLDYLGLVADIQRFEWEIHRIYTDPEVEDPEAATVELHTHVAELRAAEEARQPLAEAILEEQTACILVGEGFGTLGQEFPPVGAHFTPLPLLLVISPRDHIEKTFRLGLRHGLDVARQEAIEGQVDTIFDVSSLVTGIGGMAAYPAMLLESSSLNWVTEVTAHEWTHHYLAPRPLGRPRNAHYQRDCGLHRREGSRATSGSPLLPRTSAARAGGAGRASTVARTTRVRLPRGDAGDPHPGGQTAGTGED